MRERIQAPLQRLPARYALLIAGSYFVLGALYIGLSDHAVASLASSIAQLHTLELLKGWLFIAVTAVGLYLFSKNLLHKLSAHAVALAQHQERYHLLDRRALAGALASSVAHDCNNVLQLARVNAELLRARPEPEVRELASEIEGAVERLVEMMRRLRDLGRPERAGQPREIDVSSEVSAIVARLRKHERVRTCAVTCESDGPLRLRAHPILLDQLVTNLVLNAAEASGGKGAIRVAVRSIEGGARLEVEDEGPGIPEELRERIFDPFFTTKAEGTGLGLLSVRACAEAHRGELSLDASARGGARFVVTLREARPASA